MKLECALLSAPVPLFTPVLEKRYIIGGVNVKIIGVKILNPSTGLAFPGHLRADRAQDHQIWPRESRMAACAASGGLGIFVKNHRNPRSRGRSPCSAQIQGGVETGTWE